MRTPPRLALAATLLALCGAPAARPQATNIPAAVARTMTVSTNGVVKAPKTAVYWPTQTNYFHRATVTNLTVSTITGVDATEVAVADSGNYFTGTNAETVLQELGASVAAAVGDLTAVQVSGGLLSVSSGTGPVPTVGLTTSAVRNATAIYLPLAGGTMTGILDLGDLAITNVNRIVFDPIGSSTRPYISVSGTDALLFTLPGSFTQMVYTTTSGLVPVADLAQSGASLNQVPIWNGSEWAPGTVSAGISGGTGSTDNLALRADGAGGATLQSSDLLIGDASTSTANNLLLSNNHSGQTNSSLGLAPKGTGAFFIGPRPDGTSSGGNARGNYAVDMQMTRNTAAKVASGASSAIGGGDRNTASGTYSCVPGGYANTASGNFASLAFGYGATASGDGAIAFGNSPTASHANSFVVGLDTSSGPSSDRAEQLKFKGDGGFTLQNATGTLTHWGKWTSAPSSGIQAGDVYYDTGTNKMRCYDGTAWNDLW